MSEPPEDDDLIPRLREYLKGYSTYPRPERVGARRYRLSRVLAAVALAAVPATAIAIGFAAGHLGPTAAPVTSPTATGTAPVSGTPVSGTPTTLTVPTASATPGATSPGAGTPQPTPTAAATPTPGAGGCGSAAGSPVSGAAISGIKAYPVAAASGGPEWMAPGPLGVWFASAQGIGQVTPAGRVTLYPAPSSWTSGSVGGPAFGAGCIWTTESHDGQVYIGEWSSVGTLDGEFPVPGFGAYTVTYGPDGALWWTGIGSSSSQDPQAFIGRMTVSGRVTTYPLPQPQDPAYTIVAGADGALWFDIPYSASIGRITTSGQISVFPIPGGKPGVLGIRDALTAGPDGAIWAASYSNQRLARIASDGSVQEYSTASCGSPDSITAGGDGNLWFTSANGVSSLLCRMSASGQVTGIYPLPSTFVSAPWISSITSGADGDVWFDTAEFIGQLDPASPPSSAPITSPSS